MILSTGSDSEDKSRAPPREEKMLNGRPMTHFREVMGGQTDIFTDERLRQNHLHQSIVGRTDISKTPKNIPRLENGPEFCYRVGRNIT